MAVGTEHLAFAAAGFASTFVVIYYAAGRDREIPWFLTLLIGSLYVGLMIMLKSQITLTELMGTPIGQLFNSFYYGIGASVFLGLLMFSFKTLPFFGAGIAGGLGTIAALGHREARAQHELAGLAEKDLEKMKDEIIKFKDVVTADAAITRYDTIIENARKAIESGGLFATMMVGEGWFRRMRQGPQYVVNVLRFLLPNLKAAVEYQNKHFDGFYRIEGDVLNLLKKISSVVEKEHTWDMREAAKHAGLSKEELKLAEKVQGTPLYEKIIQSQTIEKRLMQLNRLEAAGEEMLGEMQEAEMAILEDLRKTLDKRLMKDRTGTLQKLHDEVTEIATHFKPGEGEFFEDYDRTKLIGLINDYLKNTTDAHKMINSVASAYKEAQKRRQAKLEQQHRVEEAKAAEARTEVTGAAVTMDVAKMTGEEAESDVEATRKAAISAGKSATETLRHLAQAQAELTAAAATMFRPEAAPTTLIPRTSAGEDPLVHKFIFVFDIPKTKQSRVKREDVERKLKEWDIEEEFMKETITSFGDLLGIVPEEHLADLTSTRDFYKS